MVRTLENSVCDEHPGNEQVQRQAGLRGSLGSKMPSQPPLTQAGQSRAEAKVFNSVGSEHLGQEQSKNQFLRILLRLVAVPSIGVM